MTFSPAAANKFHPPTISTNAAQNALPSNSPGRSASVKMSEDESAARKAEERPKQDKGMAIAREG
jgi:hypothetical protein